MSNELRFPIGDPRWYPNGADVTGYVTDVKLP